MLLVRAVRGRFVARFQLFYSYLAFVFVWTAIAWAVSFLRPESYRSLYWANFTLMLLVEFAVILEISDHIFVPYPAIRKLGRVIVGTVSLVFLFLYVIPCFLQTQPSTKLFLSFARGASLTKVVIVTLILLTARRYLLPLGRNISGMMFGFSIYLSVSVANFAAAGEFGTVYASFLRVLFPLSYTLCLLVWTVALWRYEPAVAEGRTLQGEGETIGEPLGFYLGRFNTVLTRFLRR